MKKGQTKKNSPPSRVSRPISKRGNDTPGERRGLPPQTTWGTRRGACQGARGFLTKILWRQGGGGHKTEGLKCATIAHGIDYLEGKTAALWFAFANNHKDRGDEKSILKGREGTNENALGLRGHSRRARAPGFGIAHFSHTKVSEAKPDGLGRGNRKAKGVVPKAPEKSPRKAA